LIRIQRWKAESFCSECQSIEFRTTEGLVSDAGLSILQLFYDIAALQSSSPELVKDLGSRRSILTSALLPNPDMGGFATHASWI
jgi:hypothetical protein